MRYRIQRRERLLNLAAPLSDEAEADVPAVSEEPLPEAEDGSNPESKEPAHI